jgi:hypothetical protein
MRILLCLLALSLTPSAARAHSQRPFQPLKWPAEMRLLDRLIAMTPATHPERAQLLYRRALMYWEHANWRGPTDPQWPAEMALCVQALERVIHEHPRYPNLDTVLHLLFMARLQLDDERQARQVFASLRRQFPRSSLIPHFWYALAEHDLHRQNWTEALHSYRELERFPRFKQLYRARLKAAIAEAQLE